MELCGESRKAQDILPRLAPALSAVSRVAAVNILYIISKGSDRSSVWVGMGGYQSVLFRPFKVR